MRPFVEKTLYSGFIRCRTDVRVLRQFGLVQTIPRQPPPCRTCELCDKIGGGGGGGSDNNISFLRAMLCHLRIPKLASLTICLIFTRFYTLMSCCWWKDGHNVVLCVYHPFHDSHNLGSHWQTGGDYFC